MKYELIQDSKPDKLSEWVTKKLKEGYELYGSPGAIYDDRGRTYYQAVTKEKNSQ